MEYHALTVAREFGSGGAEVAKQLASRLGWNLLDSALVTQAAQAAHVDPALVRNYDEQVDSWLHRIARAGIWSGAFEAIAEPADVNVFDADTMAALSRSLMTEAYQQGHCVIVGRGGQCTLQGKPGVFHLFVYAPLAERVERVRNRPGAPASRDIEGWIREMDATRARYVTYNFDASWANPHLYNMMIDSSIGEEAVVRAVLAAMGRG
jgi:cytidylate kinase